MGNRVVTARKILECLGDGLELAFPTGDRWEAYKRANGSVHIKGFEEYFPSMVVRTLDRLERRGLVEKIEKDGQVTVRITDKGKRENLVFNLNNLQLKVGKWDKKWRMVFFDIEEIKRTKRDYLRRYLEKLGMKRMQDSVYVSPFDVLAEVKYIREILEIPHVVKLAEMSFIENEEELRLAFGV
jgi:DNA-binding transcriptional regulator PaaX